METTLAERLAEALETRGLSFADVAAIMKVTEGQVRRYVTGASSPRFLAMMWLCKHLDVDPAYIAFGRPAARRATVAAAKIPPDLYLMLENLRDQVRSALAEANGARADVQALTAKVDALVSRPRRRE